MICYEYKPKSSKIWRGRFRVAGQKRITDISLDTRDHQVAKERLRKRVQECEQEAEGMILPRTIRTAAHKDLADHLEDYVADLEKSGRSESHVYHVQKRIERMIAECGWRLCSDITGDTFQAWRTRQRGKSAKTLSDFFSAASAFCNWMMRQRRMEGNPLKYVERIRKRGHEVLKRRAFTDEEMRRLLAVAGHRKVVYLSAVSTGLRRSELEALQWGDVDLDSAKPVFKVRASTTKNGKPATIDLQASLVKELRLIASEGQTASDPVFSKGIPSMYVFKGDLSRAGIALTDAQGRRADFHALRHTLCTNMARAGVSPWIAMRIMRHSDIHLTTRIYTDAGYLPTQEAVSRLPDFFADLSGEKLPSHGASQESGFSGPGVSCVVTGGENASHDKASFSLGKVTICHALSPTGKKESWCSGGDLNPHDLAIISPSN